MRLAICTLLFLATGLAAEPWKLVRNEGGVRVYNRTVAGSEIPELRAEMVVRSSLSGLVALFQDLGGYSSWYDSLMNTRLVRRLGPLVLIGYAEVDFPWPASNRDMILRYSITQDPRSLTVRVRMKNMPDYLPVRPGIVRLRHVTGSWEFRAVASGRVLVVMRTHSEPGGSIPAWISEAAVTSAPLRALHGLRRHVGQPQYQRQCFAQIKEPGGLTCEPAQVFQRSPGLLALTPALLTSAESVAAALRLRLLTFASRISLPAVTAMENRNYRAAEKAAGGPWKRVIRSGIQKIGIYLW